MVSSLVHIGSMSATRDRPVLERTGPALCRRNPGFSERFVLRFVGPVDHAIIAAAFERPGWQTMWSDWDGIRAR